MNTPDPAAKRGPGRPKTRPAELVRHRLDLTPAETERARLAATAAGLSLSAYFRLAVTDALPPEKYAAKKSR